MKKKLNYNQILEIITLRNINIYSTDDDKGDLESKSASAFFTLQV